MLRRYSWLLMAGTWALLASCGPAEVLEETRSRTLGEALATEQSSPPCQPPVFVADLVPGAGFSTISVIHDLDGTPLVGVYESDHYSLWKLVEREDGSDGAPSWEAVLLEDGFSPGESLSIGISLGGRLYFTAADEEHGVELWRTDGTPEGTVRVADLYPGSGSSHPRDLIVVGRTLYFTADDGTHGREPWKLDATQEAPRLVADIHPGPTGSWPSLLTKVEEFALLFTADDGTHGREPWLTYGSASSTRLVEDIHPGPTGSEPSAFLQLRPYLFLFTADDGTHGREPWRTSGTCSSTRLVEDIHPGPTGSAPDALTVVGRKLYFSADDGTHGRELWKSHGTASGTWLVEDIRPGPESSSPYFLAPLEGKLFFIAHDGVHGREPWRSNGTPGGTYLLEDVWPGSSSWAGPSFAAEGKVFFFAENPAHGHEMWVTDGTRAGTRLMKDINPGPANAFAGDPNTPVIIGGGIITDANDGVHGSEPWWSDGTEEGTMMADLNPGPRSSGPHGFTRVGAWVYFSAHDEVHGRALWALPLACFPHTR